MIVDGHKLRQTCVVADVCIIGGGAAGITIARELARTGKSIVLLAGGGRRERRPERDLNRGEVDDGAHHEPLEEGRRRVWGGSTTAWGGRCVPLDGIDLAERSWVPDSGWPLTYDDLRPYLEQANRVCDAGPFRYTAGEAFPDAPPEMIAGFDGLDMVTSPLERWSPPTNFARRYGRELAKADNVVTLLDTHALELRRDRTGAVGHVEAATTHGARLTITAATFVVACGGLENARLLLASDHDDPGGLGNQHDNVGRYYMSHLMGVLGAIELTDPDHGFVYDFERDDGVYCRRRFWVTPAAQEAYGVGNGIGYLWRPDISDAAHGSPVLSATHLAKSYQRRLQGRPPSPEDAGLREHWALLGRQAPKLLTEVSTTFRRRYLARRRLPIVLGPRSSNRFTLLYQTEHHPNRDSRVVLGADRDHLGMRRLQPRIAFNQADIRTVEVFHQLLDARLRSTGVGRFHYRGEPRQLIDEQLDGFNSSAHHLGTTRMTTDPRLGVVDRDCRVHGVPNLFIAGSSVFPTGGHANPTLTLVALSLRLAQRLRAHEPVGVR